jgi:hypothetical protein
MLDEMLVLLLATLRGFEWELRGELKVEKKVETMVETMVVMTENKNMQLLLNLNYIHQHI